MKLLRCVILSSTLFLLLACTSTSAIRQPPNWNYEQDAIELNLVSDSKLNLFQKQSHSLILCLYHLKDPTGLNQLVDEKGGLAKLLDCSSFEPSVTYAKRLIIQPGQRVSEAMNRTEGSKFVGVVAGYYTLQKESSVRIYPIPVTEVEQGSTLVQKPAKLRIDLYLGSHEIGPGETAKTKRP